jgi:hypothetical protein
MPGNTGAKPLENGSIYLEIAMWIFRLKINGEGAIATFQGI